jgi:hypothetical protein
MIQDSLAALGDPVVEGTEANPYFHRLAEVGFSFPSESGSKLPFLRE